MSPNWTEIDPENDGEPQSELDPAYDYDVNEVGPEAELGEDNHEPEITDGDVAIVLVGSAILAIAILAILVLVLWEWLLNGAPPLRMYFLTGVGLMLGSATWVYIGVKYS